MPSAEVLAVLADEVSEVDGIIKAALADLTAAADDATYQEAIERFGEQVQRIGGVTEVLNLSGLQQACRHLATNLAALAPGDISPARQAVFEQWPKLVLGYLHAPKEGVYARELAEHFHKSDWPEPLDTGAAIALEKELLAVSDEAEEMEKTPPRQTQVRPEDITLEPAEDVNPALLEAFLTEGPLQAAHYSAAIQSVIRGEGWTDEVDEARRIIHALKGAANTVGIRGVATLAHHVEDILEYLAENAINPEGELAKLLVAVADCLEIMFEALLGTEAPPSQALQVLQDVLNVANRIDRGEFNLDEEAGEATTATAVPVEPEKAPTAVGTPAAEPVPAALAVKIEPKVRVAAKAIDDMLRLSGEMAISRGHIQERLQQTLKSLAELRERDHALWRRANDLESLVTTQGVAAGKRRAMAAVQEGGGISEAFDPLEMDQYSELHTQVHGFVEVISDLQLLGSQVLDALSDVDTAVNQQTLLNNELHDLLMTSRMLPVSTLEARLQRTVRQAADKSGKLAALEVEGGDVMLDDQMVNILIDPLQHVLRNAVDHGLEAPEVRAQFAKSETGRIMLRFAREGNYLNIKCVDDGTGLDLFRIHATAVDRGLITEDQNLSDTEIMHLILQPGFSTRGEVTELSGRGVGMDIVNANISRLKGSIDIQSEAGKGATFTLRVPMSMGIAHCLLTKADKQIFALPTDNLDRIVHGGAVNIQRMGKKWIYRDDDDTCAVHALTDLLGYQSAYAFGDEEDNRPIVLMKDLQGRVAIVVDAVTSGRDLVIKGMSKYVANIKGVVGSSILGDGSVVPILELSDLLRMELGAVPLRTAAKAQIAAEATSDILIVDDSLSVRTALSLLLNGDGLQVRTAKDGVEAIEEIEKQMPAAVLIDLEMPRMNGLELTSVLRSRTETRHLPLIMITSRTAEKHRVQAQAVGVDHYITKPYREGDLLSLLRTTMSEAA